MPDDESEQSSTVGPLPTLRFKVTIGALQGAFHEVSGLNSETPVIEYRHSTSPQFSTIKMPGIRKFGNVTLKRGMFKNDDSFWTWYSSIQQKAITGQTVVIELLDESNAVQIKWTLSNAWPTKFTGTDLRADGSEVAVETMELGFETLDVNVS